LPTIEMSTDSYEYDAYGNEFTVSGTTPNEMMYRGEQYDSDLGLYYLRARYYNPLTGRFMSRDPEDGNQYDPATLHKYLYADGNPVDLIDPTGRATFTNPAITNPRAQALTEYFEIVVNISLRAARAIAGVGIATANLFCKAVNTIVRAQVPPGLLGFGPPGWPGPVKLLCDALGFR
jgi:RHS repeat-associated protein